MWREKEVSPFPWLLPLVAVWKTFEFFFSSSISVFHLSMTIKQQQQQQQSDPKAHLIFLKLQLMHFKLKSLFSQLLLFASGLAIGFSLSLFNFPLLQISPGLAATSSYSPPPRPPPPPPPSLLRLPDDDTPPPPMHDMSDEELLWRASLAPRVVPNFGPSPPPPKIAFLFLTKNGVALAPLWELFFKPAHHSLFSIYVHSNSTLPSTSSVFFRRTIPSKVSFVIL